MAKTAFVTGNRGFIGRHIQRELLRRGFRVLGVDASAVDDAKGCFRRISDRFDLVVHCAYVVGGRATIDGRNTAIIENTMLDSMFFDWALRTRQRAVVYFSSSAAYPVAYQTKEYVETDGSYWRLPERFVDFSDHRMPDSNYGWAKLTGERMARSAAEAGLRVHTLRPFSGYGSDQSFDYPFPSIIRRAENFDFSVWGPPGQTRDWVHVDDVINATLAVYDADYREPVNICTGRGVEMGELMQLAAAELHNFIPDITYQPEKPTGVFHRVGDPTLLQTIYKPQITLEEGIYRAVKGG